MNVVWGVGDVAVAKAVAQVPASPLTLISGPPGFGKTSVLAAAVAQLERSRSCEVLWVSGRLVASEGHLLRLLGQQLNGTALDDMAGLRTDSPARRPASLLRLLAIDDLDALLFKRPRLAAAMGDLLRRDRQLRLVGTCHPAATKRLLTGGTIWHGGPVLPSVSIEPLSDSAARDLLRRRVPTLDEPTCDLIVREAGGHPAALVFLGRFVDAPAETSSPNIEGVLDRIAEFAGAVYSEAWTSLGPQQRAVLGVLGTAAGPLSAAAIAESVVLTPSHVSAQLRRLIDEGLVHPAGQRAHFQIAPLLARWIVRRVARDRDTARVPPPRPLRVRQREA